MQESSGAVYAESSTQWLDGWRTTLSVREDEFDFDVKDKMLNADESCNLESDPLGCVTGNKRASIFSPKLGIVLGPWAKTTYFINVGDGYHSNDERSVTRSGQISGQSPVTPLTRATGGEIGVATKGIPSLETRLDLFELKLKSELVFAVTPGLPLRVAQPRVGIEWSNTYHINDWLAAEFNTAFTRARFDHDTPPDDLGCSDTPTNPCTVSIGIIYPTAPPM